MLHCRAQYSILAIFYLFLFIFTNFTFIDAQGSALATTVVSPILISTPTAPISSSVFNPPTHPYLLSQNSHHPLPDASFNTDLDAGIIAMFNGTTTFLSDVSLNAWEFSLFSSELTASVFCLEIWDQTGKKVTYNATNACHIMVDNHLENFITFSTAVKKNTNMLFSITLVISALDGKWTTDLCGVFKQTFNNLSSTVTNVPILGSQTKGSPGLLLAVPEWRKQQFGVSTFSFLFLTSSRVDQNGNEGNNINLKHLFLNGMLSAIIPVAKYKDSSEHICYVNQIAHVARLVYKENSQGEEKYFYPFLEFVDQVEVFPRLQTFVICPSLEVFGKYLDPTLAGLAALGSIHLVATTLNKDKNLQFLPPSSHSSHSSHSSYSPRLLKNLPNDECTDALSAPVWGMADNESYFTTSPVLTFGTAKNLTRPLLSIKNSPVSLQDTTSHSVLILDMRGFDLTDPTTTTNSNTHLPYHNNNLLQRFSPQSIAELNYFSPTALLTFFTAPAYSFFTRSSTFLPSTFSSLFSPPRYSPSNNQLAASTAGPSLSCYATGYRLDRVNLDVISIDLSGHRVLVHSETYVSSQLSSLPLLSINVTYSTPEIRYHVDIRAIRTLDVSKDINSRVQMSCSINNSFGDKSLTVISHASIYQPIAKTLDLSTTIVSPQQNKLSIINPSQQFLSPTIFNSFSQLILTQPIPPYAELNLALVNLLEPMALGFRARWYGNHDFIGDMKQCHAIGYDKDGNQLTPEALPIQIERENDIIDLRPPFEYDPTVPLPTYLPKYEDDHVVDVLFTYIYFKVELALIPNLYSYNITCIDGYIGVSPSILTQSTSLYKLSQDDDKKNKFFTASILQLEHIKPAANTNKNRKTGFQPLHEQYMTTRTQSILVSMQLPPDPQPPPPENEEREDNLLFFSIFVLVLIITLIGCAFWLLRLKKLRDRQRKDILEQQRRQHEQMLNPSYTDEYAYQLVT